MDIFKIQNQRKLEDAAEVRQMDFSREQNRENVALKDDETYLNLQETKADLLRWQQDHTEDIVRLRYKFLGYYMNTSREWVRDENITPLCNKLFFDQIIEPTCSFYLNRSFTNSNLSEDRINKLLKKTFNNMATTLVKKHKTYAVKFNDFDDIIREIKTLVIPAAFRAIKGWTKNTDSTMIKRIEAFHEGTQQQQTKKGIFNLGG